ncbi:MAG: Efflux ABC transporter, ATP-binding protein [uncultured Nocardioidaceae bacterium]|uniref:Efflux ABC transporter, ATP-binding protein n=1 Tax=uncultured Nocardioidaceae bacterium TaxID=253824 RepID=A0A6J4MMI7_9ACTN|nr:MAG: Efflux ABC transporter, ATP-binding protein [uncultured Nocardioidaceae bacterium]
MSNAVRVDRLRVTRGGTTAVDDVSFTARTGEVTGLLGPSGSGKSSLLRAVVGVQVVAGGIVEVLGRPAGSRELRHRIGYVTQAPSVYDDLTVTENVRFFARVLGLGPQAVDEVVGAVDLGRHRDSRVARLSGGERSRVSLAVALLGTPDLLVLDEPTVGLDPVLRLDLWALFHRLAREGAAVVVSSHVMDEAQRCDRLLLMRSGRLVADDSPEGLLARTGTADVESAFLALVRGQEAR